MLEYVFDWIDDVYLSSIIGGLLIEKRQSFIWHIHNQKAAA
jgi:hypothetical protein